MGKDPPGEPYLMRRVLQNRGPELWIVLTLFVGAVLPTLTIIGWKSLVFQFGV